MGQTTLSQSERTHGYAGYHCSGQSDLPHFFNFQISLF